MEAAGGGRRAWALSLALVVIGPAVTWLPETGEAAAFFGGPEGFTAVTYLVVTAPTGTYSGSGPVPADAPVEIMFVFDGSAAVAHNYVQTDCDDIRFVRVSDGATLPHWVESGCNTNTTVVWFRAPYLLTGANDFRMYSGNPTATSTASAVQTFQRVGATLFSGTCMDPVYCFWADDHAEMDVVREYPADICTMTTTVLSYGSPCDGTSFVSNVRNDFFVRARFLFIPDTTGTWTFNITGDDAGELMLRSTDAAFFPHTHTLVAAGYRGCGICNGRQGTVSLTAGEGVWMDFTFQEKGGSEGGRIRVSRPGSGTLTVLSEANFPDSLRTRTYTASYSISSTGGATLPSAPRLPQWEAWDEWIESSWGAPTSWGNNATPAGYAIYRGTSPTALALVGTTGVTPRFFNHLNLTNGVTYYIGIAARSNLGEGPMATFSAMPLGPPDPPQNLTAIRGNGFADLSWDPPQDTGGLPIEGYAVYERTAGGLTFIGDSVGNTSWRVGSLTNGVTYRFEVDAFTDHDASTLAVVNVTPATVPDAPALAVTPGNRTASLSWTAGATGGAPILGWRVTVSPGGVLHDGSDPLLATLEATGLDNGTSYTFSVEARNDVGYGAAAQVGVVPRSIPDPPFGLVATPLDHAVSLSWQPPASSGGLAVTAYDLTDTDTATVTRVETTSAVIGDLANGVAKTYTVRAVSAAGVSAPSVAATATPRGVPGPAQGVSIEPGDGKLTVLWTPGDENGAPRLLQTLIFTYGGIVESVAVGANATTYAHTGLGINSTRIVEILATNEAGVGAPSDPVTAATFGPPWHPLLTAASGPGAGQVTLTWSPPLQDGGQPIHTYEVHEAGELVATLDGTARTYSRSGLAPGQTINLSVTAINAVGAGPTAFVAPSAFRLPTELASFRVARGPGVGQLNLSWSPPIDDGGMPPIRYEVEGRVDSTGATYSLGPLNGSTRAIVDADLPPREKRSYRARAVTDVGPSPWTGWVSNVTFHPPSAPRGLQAAPGTGSIVLRWTPPEDDGGLAVRMYRVLHSSTTSGPFVLLTTVPGASTSYEDRSSAGTPRFYRLVAANDAGNGPESATAGSLALLATPSDPTEVYRTCTTPGPVCSGGSTRPVVEISAGGRHTCVRLDSLKVDCYGDNAQGQAEDHVLGTAGSVSAGARHTCVLVLHRGDVDCYGHDAWGKATSYVGGDALAVSAGGDHTCFLLTGGRVRCQGLGADGQVVTDNAGNASVVVAGGRHTCILRIDRSVDCHGVADARLIRDNAHNVSQVTAGGAHTCLLRAGRIVDCAGLSAPVPRAIQGLAIRVASGKDHACALLVNGNVACWGSDRFGQSAGYAGGDAIAVSAGETHTCILRENKTVVCVGRGTTSLDYGQSTPYPGG